MLALLSIREGGTQLPMHQAVAEKSAANTIVASRSTTVTPVSSRPATCSQGNPSGRAASRSHQCRRNSVTAVFSPLHHVRSGM